MGGLLLRRWAAFRCRASLLESFWAQCYPAAMLQDLKHEKPWAKLRMSRRQYERARPWAKSGMSRPKWEELILLFPDDAVDALYREADADKLISALFGNVE